jgi:cytochrome b561
MAQGRAGHTAAVAHPVSRSSTTPLSLPPTLSVYSLCLSNVEVIFALLEFLLAMSVTRELLSSAYRALHPASAESGIPHYNAFVMHLAVNITVFLLVLWRLAQRLRLPVGELLQRLGLTLPQLLSASTFSRMTLAVIVLHSLGFAGMILSQRLYNAGGSSIFSLSNYYHKDSDELDWNMSATHSAAQPLRRRPACSHSTHVHRCAALSPLCCCDCAGSATCCCWLRYVRSWSSALSSTVSSTFGQTRQQALLPLTSNCRLLLLC